jgi:hypothetical protein
MVSGLKCLPRSGRMIPPRYGTESRIIGEFPAGSNTISKLHWCRLRRCASMKADRVRGAEVGEG